MNSATLYVEIGKDAKDYVKVMDKDISLKRSKMKVSTEKNKIKIEIEAEDNVALLSSLNSIIKQMRIIGNAYSIK